MTRARIVPIGMSDHVVLIAAEGRLALRLEHAEDAVRVAPDADVAADRVVVAEEVRRDGRAEDADLRLRRLVVLVPLRAALRPSSFGP